MSFVVFFDLETGGVQLQHPTIALGAIAVDAATGKEAAAISMHLQFNEAECDPEALRINGYTADAWKGAITPRHAVREFSQWLKPFQSVPMKSKNPPFKEYTVAMLAGYNAVSFDLPRLKALYGADFFPCSYLVRDVLQRVLFYFDERPSVTPPVNFKLATVAEYFGIEASGAHDALADARMSAAIAYRLREEVW